MCRLCVSSVFGATAGFDMNDANQVFPQGVLTVIPLIRGVVGDWKI